MRGPVLVFAPPTQATHWPLGMLREEEEDEEEEGEAEGGGVGVD